MQYRELGRTGLRMSEVGFGAWAIGGPANLGATAIGWGQVDDDVSLRAIDAALDAGVNFFDTADAYGAGHSEELLAKAFAGKRDKVIVASKVGNRTINGKWMKDYSPAWIREAVDHSLRRLTTDCIDAYQLHSPGADFTYGGDVIAALEDIKAQGKIRFYGVSLTPPGGDLSPSEQGLRILETGRCDFFQVVYNILERDIEADLLPACARDNVGVIARVPLASGFLTGKFTKDATFPPDDHRSHRFPPAKVAATVEKVERLRFLTEGRDKTLAQAALQYVLSHPAVSTVIPGAKTAAQARDNAAASDGALLSEDELRRVREVG